MKKFGLLLLGLSLVACAGGKSGTGLTADNASLNNIDAFSSRVGQGKIECDGEGTEFSGNYSFKFTNNTVKCPNRPDTQTPPSMAIYQCGQKDTEFSCVNQNATNDTFNGCINKDGRYKLKFNIKKADDDSQQNIHEGFVVGTLGKADGKTQYVQQAVTMQEMRQPCVSMSNLEVIQVAK